MDPHSPTGFGDADRSSSRISARDPSASREAISKKVIVEWGAGGGKASDDVVRQRCRGMWKSPKISTVIVHGPGDPPTGGDVPDKGKDEEKEMDFLISIFEMRFNYQDFWIFGIWNFLCNWWNSRTRLRIQLMEISLSWMLEWKSTETSPCNVRLAAKNRRSESNKKGEDERSFLSSPRNQVFAGLL